MSEEDFKKASFEAFISSLNDYPSQDNEGYQPQRGDFKSGFLCGADWAREYTKKEYEDKIYHYSRKAEEIEYVKNLKIELLEEMLEIAGNACGIAADFLEFHCEPSINVDNCIKLMKTHEKNALSFIE